MTSGDYGMDLDDLDVPGDDHPMRPAELAIPDLVGEVMHMETIEHGELIIELYKHDASRGYIALDYTGRPWEVALAGGDYTVTPTTLAAATAQLLNGDDD